ncbi:hypothetical protein [Niabella aquatica]
MSENRIWLLMARKLSGEASEKELKEFEELLKEGPELLFLYEIISCFWNNDAVIHQKADKNELQEILKRYG